ncbi:MAG: hypothetical protein ABIC40_08095 [bacterium]
MTGSFFIFLKSPTLATEPAALGTLNHLGIAFFLVSIGLLILISVHYYRMKDSVERKRKFKDKHSKIESDPVMQLQFMSREELKSMVISEREKNPDGREEPSVASAQGALPVETSDDWITISTEILNPPVSTQQMLFPEPESGSDHKADSPFSPKSESVLAEEAKAPTDAELLANLVMPKEPDADEKKEGDKPPFKDKVTRSALSNELPEEFRRKSRKI